MKREPRIVMAKEVLRISPRKVVVDYDFRNDSEQNITTEVAFPVPEYDDNPNGALAKDAGFDDFRLTIDGKPVTFTTEVRAFADHREISSTLQELGVDAASFAHERYQLQDGNVVNDLARLTTAQKQRLLRVGAISSLDDLQPYWTVRKKYHWRQTFPAHATIHIRHEYTPVLGATSSLQYGLEGERLKPGSEGRDEESVKEIRSICLAPALKTKLLKLTEAGRMAPLDYVDFILTTANTWKTPIEDFTLIVEKPKQTDMRKLQMGTGSEVLTSFCWNGPISHVSANEFTAHALNLVPKKELRVGFVYVEPKS